MNTIRICLRVSYGILLIYSMYLMVILSPIYEISKKEKTIATYIGIIFSGLTIGFFILYILSELYETDAIYH